MTPEELAQTRKLIDKHGPPLSPMLIYTLMDALELAWADLAEAGEEVKLSQLGVIRERARAERAEAAANMINYHLNLADAALARVRALCAQPPNDICAYYHVDMEHIRAALDAVLDGGTET